jgi:hypothetical protein
VSKRGKKPEEVELYSLITHELWSRLAHDAPAPPVDLPDFTVFSNTQRQDDRLGQRSLAQPSSHKVTYYAPNATWGGISKETFPFEELNGNPTSFDEQQVALLKLVDEVIQAQEGVGNYWFSRDSYAEDIKLIVERHPEYVEAWTQAVFQDTVAAEILLNKLSSFYHALCVALLEINPSQGVALYLRIREARIRVRVIDYVTRFELLDHALLAATPSEVMVKEWQQRLEGCLSDKEMATVTLLAQYGTGIEWLNTYITESLSSPIPINRIRALSLLGFLDDEKTLALLYHLLETLPDTRLRKLANRVKQQRERNAWAKYWFRLFLTEADDIAAWAAFRLFLQCVDGRFLLWGEIIQKEVGKENIPSQRKVFLSRSRDDIRSSIKENEKELEERLFGEKVQSQQVWPWM